jgi:hypothetical protein
LNSSLRRLAIILPLVLTGCLWAVSRDQKKDQKEPSGKKVDSGSFGVFIDGHRIGTETFSIYQGANGSIIQSEFKTEGSAAPTAAQSSEMQLAANGEIRRYDWKELSPGKAQSTVVPNDDFLTEKWSESPQEKPREQAFLLSSSTSILDDYFFVHRELLSWKFLAASCKQENGQVKCPLKQRTQFGTLNPRQRSSAPISMQFAGREKVSLHGADTELIKLELKSETGDWDLWLNDQLMLERITIPAERTEVVRD